MRFILKSKKHGLYLRNLPNKTHGLLEVGYRPSWTYYKDRAATMEDLSQVPIMFRGSKNNAIKNLKFRRKYTLVLLNPRQEPTT